VNYFELEINPGLRLYTVRVDLNSIYSVDENNANKMSVPTATGTWSKKHQEYLKKCLIECWLLPEMSRNGGDFTLPFKVDDEEVMASDLLDTLDGFLDLASEFNVGIDALNGEEDDGYGGKKKLYINYEIAHGELKRIRGIF
jgi:hypothetical protein